jgi:hypothetical protein
MQVAMPYDRQPAGVGTHGSVLLNGYGSRLELTVIEICIKAP